MIMKKTISFLLLLTIYTSMLAPLRQTANAQIIGKAMETKTKDLPNGLQFRLSEGVEGAETRTKSQPAKTDPLSENESSNF